MASTHRPEDSVGPQKTCPISHQGLRAPRGDPTIPPHTQEKDHLGHPKNLLPTAPEGHYNLTASLGNLKAAPKHQSTIGALRGPNHPATNPVGRGHIQSLTVLLVTPEPHPQHRGITRASQHPQETLGQPPAPPQEPHLTLEGS